MRATGADPHLLIGTIELYKATRKAEFLEAARARVRTMLKPAGFLTGGYSNSGEVPCAALGMFALSFPRDPLAATIKQRLKKATRLPGGRAAESVRRDKAEDRPGRFLLRASIRAGPELHLLVARLGRDDDL